LVAAHGGIVGAESRSDGVTVWFELPLRAHADQSSRHTAERSALVT
jgi:signal transduction histidine kinase